MELNGKVWITRNGETVFGRGRAELLEAIEATGSISGAARRLEMSYRHAWTLLLASERRLGYPLLHRSQGGAGGGGARLTDRARALLACYRSIESDLLNFIRERENELQSVGR